MLDSVQPACDTGRLTGLIRLLIVDDDVVDRQTYLRHLRVDPLNSYTVVEAAAAEQAIELLHDGRVDCIVLDYRLPGVDGLAVYEALNRSHTGSALPPVVMMTGQGSEDVAVEALQCGIADYLTKQGLSAKALQRAISNAVDRSRLQISLNENNQRLAQASFELNRRAAELQRVYHSVSHELKTPLTAVREFIALVHDGVAGALPSPQMKIFLEHALDGCDQMSHQVNDLVDATRLEMHKLRLNAEPVRVDRAIDIALAAIRQILEAKRMKLVTAIAQDLPLVWADPIRFGQILGNLLGNAAKFTEVGGTVTLSGHPGALDPERIEIAVADTG